MLLIFECNLSRKISLKFINQLVLNRSACSKSSKRSSFYIYLSTKSSDTFHCQEQINSLHGCIKLEGNLISSRLDITVGDNRTELNGWRILSEVVKSISGSGYSIEVNR